MDSTHPLLANFNDPPQFPPSYPQFQRLDRSVICQICKEPFTAPVSISCGHSFCSQCIRSSLDVMKKCPSCNEPATEGSIRRNRALEEITDAWDQSRSTLFDLAKPVASRKRRLSDTVTNASSPNSAKRTQMQGGRLDKCPSPFGASGSKTPEDVLEDEEEDDIQELTENDEAPCPICQARLPISSIPSHIDRGCPPPKAIKPKGVTTFKGNQKTDWKKVFSGQSLGGGSHKDGAKGKEAEMKKITKPNYSLTSPADLRTLLAQHSLPTTGDKLALISRVQEWIVLYNSNLDSSHPSSLSALRAKLAEAEASRKRDKEKGKDEVIEQLGTKDGLQKYAQDKKGEFDRLRREILMRDKRRKEGPKGAGAESAIEIE